MEALRTQLQSYARDTRLNLGALYDEMLDIEESVVFGCALSCAYTSQNSEIITAFQRIAYEKCTKYQIEGAKAAAVVMAQNNVYYRTLGLLKDAEYRNVPTKLRMNIIKQPPVEKTIFEYFCIAVSAMNGCQNCLNAHSEALLQAGWTHAKVQSALRIAAIIAAASQALVIG